MKIIISKKQTALSILRSEGIDTSILRELQNNVLSKTTEINVDLMESVMAFFREKEMTVSVGYLERMPSGSGFPHLTRYKLGDKVRCKLEDEELFAGEVIGISLGTFNPNIDLNLVMVSYKNGIHKPTTANCTEHQIAFNKDIKFKWARTEELEIITPTVQN